MTDAATNGEAADGTVLLNDGTAIPQLGFGVFQIPPHEAQEAVEAALELGYRHIDTAAAYNNEAGVGAGIRASGIPREEIFVTTKLRNGEQGFDTTLSAFDASNRALGLDYVDLYLIHWPSPARDLYTESWRAMTKLAEEKSVRSIGVSNFLEEHLERLLASSPLAPAINQIELHPTFQQTGLAEFARSKGIAIEAYSPLGQGADLELPAIVEIAEKRGVTPAQVVLGWHLGLGHVVIPKSVRRERMIENLGASALQLDQAELEAISALDADGRIGGDPRTFEITQIRA
jgi:2,5-diketo-D-gluconate reductase A